jgi:hypothetical protein
VKPALLPLPTAGDRWTSSTVLSPVARDYLRGVAAAFFITAAHFLQGALDLTFPDFNWVINYLSIAGIYFSQA